MKYALITSLAFIACLLWTQESRASISIEADALARDQSRALTTSSDTTDVVRNRFLIPVPKTVKYRVRAVSLPGTSISSPTAYGADFRDFFAVAVYQRRTRYAEIPDGALAVGFGVGDANNTAGLEIVLTNFNVFVERDRGEVRDISISAKLHRNIDSELSVAMGVESFTALRGDLGDSGTSYYGVVTKTIHLRPHSRAFDALTFSAGVGNGRFRSELHNSVDEEKRPNFFGSSALRLTRALSVIADWTGVDLNAGISVAPLKRMPLIITAAFADLTGQVGDGGRFLVGVGYGYSF